jgi:hypothetical protein
MSKRLQLRKKEKDAGWCMFSCPTHGNLVVTNARAEVWCRCNRRASRNFDVIERSVPSKLAA